MNIFFTLAVWMTDRYLLFPTIGSSLAIVAIPASFYLKRGAAGSAVRARALRRILAVAAALVIGLYSASTVARIGVWTSGLNLWSDVLRKQLNLGGSGPVTAGELSSLDSRRFVDPRPLICLRQAYDSMGNTAEAERLGSIRDRVRGGGDVINEMRFAREDLTAGRIEDALRRLKPIAEGKTLFAPLALFRMAVAEEELGDDESSRDTMRRALALYREHGQSAIAAYMEAGTTEYLRLKFSKAAEWYRLAYRESPSDADAAFHLGLALEEIGNRPEAIQLYKKIVAGDLIISPTSKITITDVYLQMGVAAEKLGHLREALGYFEETLRRSPNHPRRKAIQDRIAALRSVPSP
jgi:tetratricopeptide (TPR) repeat protein